MRQALMICALLLTAISLSAKEKYALKEAVSVHLRFSGDLSGEYDLDGPLGSVIEASPVKPDSVCGVLGTFRKALYRSRPALEFWLTLNCTIEGQKRTFKPHRIFLDPEKSEQDLQLPVLAKNLKKIRLDFQNLSLSKSK